jgi:hypothetical protein
MCSSGILQTARWTEDRTSNKPHWPRSGRTAVDRRTQQGAER